MMADEKRFPLLHSSEDRKQSVPISIPWALIEPHREQAMKNHSQSLETLASRGGLHWTELLAVLADSGWREMFPAWTGKPAP